jgi:cytochrome P450
MTEVISSRRIACSFDPFSPEFRADPFTHYARLRELGPLVWLEKYEIWCVHHYNQVKAVLSDVERFSNAGGSGLTNYFQEKPWRRPSLILETDPPEHTRARQILMRAFSATAIRNMRAGFETIAEELIDRALAKSEIEAVTELVQPFPLRAFPDVVGMPPLDRETLITYGSIVFGAMGPITDWYRELMREAERVGAWIDRHCARENLSADGIGADIYKAADKGEVSQEEARLLVRSLLSAGVDTTIDSIGLAVKCLAERPDQYVMLRSNPSLAKAAFEEATRFDSSSPALFRTTTTAFEFEGQQLDRHQKIMIFIASAGRDPAQWQEPDVFRIDRRIVGQIGFGWGIHACVAQVVARLEGEVFLQKLAERTASIEQDGTAELRLTPGLRGLSRLPLRLH